MGDDKPRGIVHKLAFQLNRLLACVAAGCVLYCEVTGSTSNKKLLVGASTPPAHTVAYQSHLIQQFLPSLVSTPAAVNRTIHHITGNHTSSSFVVYLDGDTTAQQQQTPALQSDFCSKTTDYDYLYYDTYLDIVLTEVFVGYGGWNSSKYWVLVDCSYDGRMFSDTTVIKFYLLDKAMTRLTSFMLQTLSITRPEKQLMTSGGAAMWTTTNLSSFKVGDHDKVTSSEIAAYSTAIGFTFPYEPNNFDPILLDDSVPPDGQWRAQVPSTQEKFLFAGTTGIYRRSPTIQGSFNYFYWELPSDPVAFASTIQFVGVKVFKDSWGWFRCFLGIGIGSNIVVNFCVALMVMLNLYREKNIFWIPDVYPSIQSRAMIRAGLLLLDCIMNSWWYPYQWAVNQGSKRNHWGGTLDFNESSRADGLMVVLAITFLAAKALHVRVQLVIVVFIYALCYYMRQSLIASCGLFLDVVTPFIKKNYFENILPTGNDAMDLWAYHENFTTNFWLIANECTYLIVATGTSLGYVFLTMVSLKKEKQSSRDMKSFVRLRKLNQIHPEVKDNGGPQETTTTFQMLPNEHWAQRSTLYGELNELDVQNCNVERCTGRIADQIYGFVASARDYEYEQDQMFVTGSGVWLLGFVIVNDQYVVNINHYIYLLINTLSGQTYFTVYGFTLQGDTVSRRKQIIFTHDVHRRDVWRVSLKRLR
ncbi:hypothetical protein AC1031_005660 [Aphanomyces cochlioides]|nr:hypothetical protein AC1031_005660 [Aphanomyces cochlioides]